ncbi:putative subtilisin-like serine protease [Cantharellus anzutake]|uniref:putative subtilisin-like serine protease n=1 Tax=Cantharellus anzutake TaxID=1750568 RepID=UPI0019078D19|nr:putative subtilisin-like serine protease [Cantharellus anzutake]KAF8322001.1 putative subtilisin-like serine protease [Cantharellus anzutake]
MEFSTVLILIAILASTTTMTLGAAIRIRMQQGPVKPDSYIVVLKSGVNMEDHIESITRISARSPGSEFSITHRFGFLNGYSAHATAASLTRILISSEVDYVEADGIVSVNYDHQEDANDVSVGMGDDLARIQGRGPAQGDGDGATIFVIDSGIFVGHILLAGRSVWGASVGGWPLVDKNGHGTCLAGIVARIAPSATLVAVRVTDDNDVASDSALILGINYARLQYSKLPGPAIVLVSWTTPPCQALDRMIRKTIASGLHVVVSAGNDASDAKNFSPGSVVEAIIVGAVDSCYRMAWFSNWGPSITVSAQGVNIRSASISGRTAWTTASGTSMSAARVAGLVAAAAGRSVTPAALKAALITHALPAIWPKREDTTDLVAMPFRLE